MIQFLRHFRDDEEASVAVETIIMLPALFWAYMGLFTIFDVYREHAVQQKAAYTISDVISRETTPLNSTYLAGTREMLSFLTSQDSSKVALRVTSVRYDAGDKKFKRDWSKTSGWVSNYSDSDVAALTAQLPTVPNNERVTIVETFTKYTPTFKTGLQDRTIHNFVFTRPRYAPRVLWD